MLCREQCVDAAPPLPRSLGIVRSQRQCLQGQSTELKGARLIICPILAFSGGVCVWSRASDADVGVGDVYFCGQVVVYCELVVRCFFVSKFRTMLYFMYE